MLPLLLVHSSCLCLYARLCVYYQHTKEEVTFALQARAMEPQGAFVLSEPELCYAQQSAQAYNMPPPFMLCFAFTKYSPQYVNALQFSCALLLSKTYAIALLYYFLLNATKLTKNLLLFAKLLYSTCAVQPNLTKNMPQLCNSVLHRTIRRLRIQVAASGSFCNGLIFFVRPVVIVH